MGFGFVALALLNDLDPEPPAQQGSSRRQVVRPPDDAGLWRTVPRCTGSMEPAITCLDHTLSRLRPAPDDIEVSSVIGYESCGLHNLHRVVEIHLIGGKRHYLAKGDNNLHPDNCLVPHEDVTQLVVRVERNLVPENAWLRDEVNAARAEMLANPDDPDAAAKYRYWRDVAATTKYRGSRTE